MRQPVVAVAVVLALGALATVVGAQHSGHAPGTGGDPHRRLAAAQEEFDRVLAAGRGGGLAFVADQNGYPGPLHVLELKDHLRLTPEQEQRMHALVTAMFAASRPRSAALLDAEARLQARFAKGIADAASIEAAVAEAERARAEVRLVHLPRSSISAAPPRASASSSRR
jgi:Spy/CpxP family protein refolding chaperone